MNKTLIGSFAILMWSSLAIFTVGAKNIPPFELLGICFSISFFIGFIWCLKNGINLFKNLNYPLHVWLVGVGGLFGYHLFYFLAIQNAPALQSNLINYLWPLLIVLFSTFLPNEKLYFYHILGAICGLIGTIFLLVNKNSLENSFHFGYIYALLAACIWASYSVISRKFEHVPTFLVAGFSLVVAIFSFTIHFLFEQTTSIKTSELFWALLLGLGPVGGAFYVWDIGMKKGDIKFLGTLSYAIPLFSTLLLTIFGFAKISLNVIIACILIILGSLISSGKLNKKKDKHEQIR